MDMDVSEDFTVVGRLSRWFRDRPPPWSRDCDCCFEFCPETMHCMKQSDGLFLACRGESVGELFDRHWADSPLLMSTAALGIVLALALFVRQQSSELRRARSRSATGRQRRRRRGAREAESESEDSSTGDDDSSDET
jgi:hypothetical protein